MSDPLRTLLFSTIFQSETVVGPQNDDLNRAAEALAETLKTSPKEIPRLALNAFLPNGQPEGLSLARTALEAEWATFSSEKKDGGLPYLRAVSVLALMSHLANPIIGSGLYLLLVDPLSRQGEQFEAPLRDYVLDTLRATYKKAAKQAWTTVEVDVPTLKVSAPKSLTLSDESLAEVQKQIHTAMMGTPVGQYHHYHQGIQNLQNLDAWASAVSQAITKSTSSLVSTSLSPVVTALSAPLKDMGKFSPALTQALQEVKLTERRMNVMWWMQARYSPSLKQAYRALGAWPSAFRMAYDLDDLVPRPAQDEIEAVLVEAWHVLFGEPTPDTLTSILKTVATQDPNFTDPKATSSAVPDTILRALAAAAHPKLTQKQVTAMTGVAGNSPLTGPEFALWVFRTYQAQGLLS